MVVRFDESWILRENFIKNVAMLCFSPRSIKSCAQALLIWFDIENKTYIQLVKLLSFASNCSVDLVTLNKRN